MVLKYIAVIRFILIFLGTYLLLALLYTWYLDNAASTEYFPDYLTHLVALQSEALIAALGYKAEIRSGFPETSIHLLVNGQFVARVIEGCNAASIIILFIAFMLAFFGRVKATLIYITAGTVIIYLINVVRIALMAIGIFEYPHYAHFLHGIIFPLIIYGTVFVLWLVWIFIFSKQLRI